MSVVVITGASSGIGKGIALFFAEQKWRLSLSGRNVKALAEVAAQCVKKGALEVVTTAGDLTEPATREAIVKNTVDNVIQLTQLALPHVIEAKGTVVNINSGAGLFPIPGNGYYCMSKAALDQFTKVLALEVADKGVRVNSVNPGLITSEFQIRAGMPTEFYTEFIEAFKPICPMKRIGEPIEIAKAVFFLATEASSFTTGELLKVDGGFELARPRVNL